MNEMEIDNLPDLVKTAEDQQEVNLPNARHLARVLVDYKDWVNRRSDGWPYWSHGRKKADRAVETIQKVTARMRRTDPVEDVSAVELTAVLKPIRALLMGKGAEVDRIAPLRPETREKTTSEMLQEILDSTITQLTEAKFSDEAMDEFREGILEIRYKRGTPFVVLLGFGGPNVWIEHDTMTTQWALKGAWGSDSAVLYDPVVKEIGEMMLELVDNGVGA